MTAQTIKRALFHIIDACEIAELAAKTELQQTRQAGAEENLIEAAAAAYLLTQEATQFAYALQSQFDSTGKIEPAL
jgi:hypothetical protein